MPFVAVVLAHWIEDDAQVLVAERYRLHASLGRGGMGEVWRATDEVLGRAVAVKLLLGDGSGSEAAARFRLEAQTAARLSHPYVVAVFDFGAWNNRFYLVMELVEGNSLAQELTAAGTLGAERVAAVAAQAAAGLAAAHRQGIVHRDIKPGNLLSDAEGTVKIGDFGIARFVDDPSSALTTAGQIVGTSLYLAPERALGRPASAASDVYSLGCVLYQLLTGRPPFRAETATVTLHQHIDTPPVPPRQHGVQLPPAFENYLLGLLAKRPEDRPTAQQVADWFGTGAWRGRPEPLPMPSPSAVEPPSTTTHRLPSPPPPSPPSPFPTPSTGRRARQRGGVRALVTRRPRVAGAVGGVVLFLLALLAGMTVFSPDNSATETRPPATSPTPDPETTPAPTPTPTPTPTPSVLTTPSAIPSPTEDPDRKPGKDKQDKQDKEGDEGDGDGGDD